MIINHIKDIVIAIFIGVVISGIYVLIYHLLDNTIKSEIQIEKNIGLKNLINIPLENSIIPLLLSLSFMIFLILIKLIQIQDLSLGDFVGNNIISLISLITSGCLYLCPTW